MNKPDVFLIVFSVVLLVAGVSSPGAITGEPTNVRQPAASGSFYPGDPDELEQTVDELLAEMTTGRFKNPLVAIISPHAGYDYSGHVAAQAFAQLAGRDIETVVIISPCHVESFKGVSVYDGDGYATPLGVVPVDEEFSNQLADSDPLITRSIKGHGRNEQGRGEHALEVQIPFLQRVLSDFRLVPVVMGDQSYETCRALGVSLADLIKDQRTLIVASSDLSHFHSYARAVQLDHKVVTAIEKWDFYCLSRNFASRTWEACGGGPIVAAMMAAQRLGANRAVKLEYANSGDVPQGDRTRVVGYLSAILVKDEAAAGQEEYTLRQEEKDRLLEIAQKAVEKGVRDGKSYDVSPAAERYPGLLEERGAFVTLNKDGRLRGCIGYVFPVQPLCTTVRDVATHAALRDRRFKPVGPKELADLEYEISVLSPLRLVTNTETIQVGKHGLLIKKGQQEGLLLPQVAAERGWDRITFLEQTCVKAGLPADTWKDAGTDIFAFTALVFGERSGH
jgi:AmmeMemoRadiSam system protein B/AmmeMemoRadiSam system protein A